MSKLHTSSGLMGSGFLGVTCSLVGTLVLGGGMLTVPTELCLHSPSHTLVGFGIALLLYSVALCNLAMLYRVDAFRRLHEVSLPYWAHMGKYMSFVVAVGQYGIFIACSVTRMDYLTKECFKAAHPVVRFASPLLHAICTFVLLFAMNKKRQVFQKVTFYLGVSVISITSLSLIADLYSYPGRLWSAFPHIKPIQTFHDVEIIMKRLGVGLFIIASGHWQQIPFRQLSVLSPLSRTLSTIVASLAAILVYVAAHVCSNGPLGCTNDMVFQVFGQFLLPVALASAWLFMLLSGCQMVHAASEQVQLALVELIGDGILFKNVAVTHGYVAVLTQCVAFYIGNLVAAPRVFHKLSIFSIASLRGYSYSSSYELIGLLGAGSLLVAGPAWMHRCHAARSTRDNSFRVAFDWVCLALFAVTSVAIIVRTYLTAFPLDKSLGISMNKHFLRVPILVLATVLAFKLLCSWSRRPRQRPFFASVSSAKAASPMLALALILLVNTLIFIHFLAHDATSTVWSGESLTLSVESSVLSHFGYAFTHNNAAHFILSTLAIVQLCPVLLRELTILQFYAFYLAAVAFASASPFLHWLLCCKLTDVIGASNVLYAVVGAIACTHRTNFKLWMLPLSAPASVFLSAMLMIDFLGVMLCGMTKIDHIGHILGAIFGLLFYKRFKTL